MSEDNIRNSLVRLDAYHTRLGVECYDLMDFGFDPDATYTPMEHEIRHLMDLLGYDWEELN